MTPQPTAPDEAAETSMTPSAAGTDPGPPRWEGEDFTVVPVRHPLRWVSGAIVLILLALVVRAFATADINYPVVVEYLTSELILIGVYNTLRLLVLAMLMGVVLGVLLAVMRQSENPVLRHVAAGYTWFFRGTPLLVQLLIWFNLSIVFDNFAIPGLVSIPMNDLMTPFVAALLGLGFNEGAYISEIARSGIISVDNGQREAAAAIGMSRSKTMRRIVLPQALRVIVPPLSNEFIACLKYSSLAFTISYSELLHSANKIYTANYMVIELLFTASIWYLFLTTIFTVFQQMLERRLSRGIPGAVRPSFSSKLRQNISLRRH